MWQQNPYGRRPAFAGFGGGPPARDVLVLLAVVFVTFSMQFFGLTAPLIGLLRLGPEVFRGFLWQPLTYPFAGVGGPSVWILLELLILYWFTSDVFGLLGRKRFWRLILMVAVSAAVVALVVDLFGRLTGTATLSAYSLMQGQRMLITITIAAFATLRRDATILLFFVLPVRAGHFIWLEILFAFIAFLGSKDLPGFLAICAAVGLTWYLLTHRSSRGVFKEARLRVEKWLIQRKLARMRRKSNLRVAPGGKGGSDSGGGSTPPWVNRVVHAR